MCRTDDRIPIAGPPAMRAGSGFRLSPHRRARPGPAGPERRPSPGQCGPESSAGGIRWAKTFTKGQPGSNEGIRGPKTAPRGDIRARSGRAGPSRRYGPGDTAVHRLGRPDRTSPAGRPVQDVCAPRRAGPGRPDRAGHEHGDPQARLEQAVQPQGRHYRVRAGLLLGMLLGATAPNAETLPIKLPLSYLLPSLNHQHILASLMLYASDILACLGLAGMLWAHSQGWRPDPRRLLLVSSAIVAVMVSLTPVGSSDTASYAAYGRIASLGGNPYTTNPLLGSGPTSAYTLAVGTPWKKQSSVYGPFATVIQSFAASIGGPHVATTIWVLMILNGAVFIGVGYLLLKTSDDPLRATLFWTANPVLIQQLVSGGHLDTFVAAAAICAIQVARRVPDVGRRADRRAGRPRLRDKDLCGADRDRARVATAPAARMDAHRPDRGGVTGDARHRIQRLRAWRAEASLRRIAAGHAAIAMADLRTAGEALGVNRPTMANVISILWPIAMIVVAWFIYQRISSDQPREVVAPFALTFAWILVAPWVFAWYTAVAWAALTQVPRNRMTRWLAIVTVLLALCRSGGGHGRAVAPRPAIGHGRTTGAGTPARPGLTTAEPAEPATWKGPGRRAGRSPAGRPGGAGQPSPGSPGRRRPALARPGHPAAALAGRRAAGRRRSCSGCSPSSPTAPRSSTSTRRGTCTTPMAWIPSATRGRCGRSCSWPTSTRSPPSSTCSAWRWPW